MATYCLCLHISYSLVCGRRLFGGLRLLDRLTNIRQAGSGDAAALGEHGRKCGRTARSAPRSARAFVRACARARACVRCLRDLLLRRLIHDPRLRRGLSCPVMTNGHNYQPSKGPIARVLSNDLRQGLFFKINFSKINFFEPAVQPPAPGGSFEMKRSPPPPVPT